MKTIVALILLTILTGCHRTIIRSGARGEGRENDERSYNLIYGITDGKVNASECKYGLSQVEVSSGFVGFLIYSFTFGLVDAKDVSYVCAEEPREERSRYER